jgi:hypothetical protein
MFNFAAGYNNILIMFLLLFAFSDLSNRLSFLFGLAKIYTEIDFRYANKLFIVYSKNNSQNINYEK